MLTPHSPLMIRTLFRPKNSRKIWNSPVKYTPEYDGYEGNHHNDIAWRDPYERVIPEHFTGETADTFTAKIIKEFALEGKDEDTGKPNGKFTVTKAQTRKAAEEVLETHTGLKGADAEAHLAK